MAMLELRDGTPIFYKDLGAEVISADLLAFLRGEGVA